MLPLKRKKDTGSEGGVVPGLRVYESVDFTSFWNWMKLTVGTHWTIKPQLLTKSQNATKIEWLHFEKKRFKNERTKELAVGDQASRKYEAMVS